MNHELKLVEVDYHNQTHAKDLVFLLDAYAASTEGGGKGLSENVRQTLAASLADRVDTFSVLAYVDGNPAGLVNCIEGFSTFQARPLLNIHDVTVHADYRRQGIARRMFERVEDIAARRGCCKITLEVLTQNATAIAAYEAFGFARYELDPRFGHAVMMEKRVDAKA